MEFEFHWQTSDGLTIYAKDWHLDHPKAVICMVHGFGEHINRYTHVAKFFNDHGYAFIGNDRRGHGMSEGKRGHTSGYNAFLDEVEHLILKARKRYPKVPILLYGHSMGGNIVLNYLVKDKDPGLLGAIITGPWIALNFQPSTVKLKMASIANKVFPGFSQKADLNSSHLSRDPLIGKMYDKDELVTKSITAATAFSMFEKAAFLDTYTSGIDIPLLAMHGEDDKIISNIATQNFVKRNPTNIHLKLWPGAYHEIHNETNKEEVFEYTLKWIESLIK
jgi:alpha-beta hydrolase superfamily lysophospholipase